MKGGFGSAIGAAMAERIEGRSVTNPLFFDPIHDVTLRSGYDVNPKRNVNVQSSVLPSWRQITQPPPSVSSPDDHAAETVVHKQAHDEVSVQNWRVQDPRLSAQLAETPTEDDITEEIHEIIEPLLADALATPEDERRSKFSSDTCLLACTPELSTHSTPTPDFA